MGSVKLKHRVLGFLIAMLWVASPAFAFVDGAGLSAEEKQQGFKPLFDGKTMAGWEGNEKFFRIEKGAIVAGTLKAKIPQNEFLCTEKKYGDFDLRLDVKLIGEGDNAGVQFRTKRIPNDSEVSGYQADVGRAWNRSVWGALYDESRRRKMLAEGPKDQVAKLTKQGEWNSLRVLAKGERIQIFLNGQLTVDYTEKDKEIANTGIIGLQIHSGKPSEAWYRNIRLLEL